MGHGVRWVCKSFGHPHTGNPGIHQGSLHRGFQAVLRDCRLSRGYKNEVAKVKKTLKRGQLEVKLRSKGGAGICSPDQTRTTIWKPPLTDPRIQKIGERHAMRLAHTHKNGRKESLSSMDGSGLLPPPKNPVGTLGSCRRVLQKGLHSREPAAEHSHGTPKSSVEHLEPSPAFQTLHILLPEKDILCRRLNFQQFLKFWAQRLKALGRKDFVKAFPYEPDSHV